MLILFILKKILVVFLALYIFLISTAIVYALTILAICKIACLSGKAISLVKTSFYKTKLNVRPDSPP